MRPSAFSPLYPLLCFLTLVLGLLSTAPSLTAAYEFGDIRNPDLKSLHDGNFGSSTGKGMWLIEFYSPYCKHCKKFAPVWEDLTEMNEHLQDSSEFYMARVDCIAQGDLCDRENIPGFPQLRLYADGSFIEKYTGDRTYEEITSYIEARAAEYRIMKAAQRDAGAGRSRPRPRALARRRSD